MTQFDDNLYKACNLTAISCCIVLIDWSLILTRCSNLSEEPSDLRNPCRIEYK